jgi:phosphoadenosine phosphosulfate reductase
MKIGWLTIYLHLLYLFSINRSLIVASSMDTTQQQQQPQQHPQPAPPHGEQPATVHSVDDDDSSSSSLSTETTTAAMAATRQQQQQEQQQRYLHDELQRRSCAVDRIRFILQYAQQHNLKIVQTTSFGIQSALMLQLLSLATSTTSNKNSTQDVTVPVIFIDTGYLHPETYRYAEQMRERFGLDLHIYQSDLSPARMEALYGKLWEDESDEAHRRYNTMRKVRPMEVALDDLQADIILTGVRASQTSHRQNNLSIVNLDHLQRLKVCPIFDWDDDAVDTFFASHELPYHPLYQQGYRSVGDWHSSQRYNPAVHDSVRDSRFRGRAQECGLHVPLHVDDDDDEDGSSSSSMSPPLLFLSTSPASSSTRSDNDNNSGAAQSIVTRESSSLTESSSWDHSSHHDNVDEHNNNTNHTTNNNNTCTNSTDGFIVYGRSDCKYCRAAKLLLSGIADHIDPGVSVTFMEVGKDITIEELVRRLVGGNGSDNDDKNGRRHHHHPEIRTVPQILYQGRWIGGYTDLLSWGVTHYSNNHESSAAAVATFRDLSNAIVVDEV